MSSWRSCVATGAATPIPFTAKIKQTITDAVRTPQRVAPDTFDVKMLRWVTVSPDQRSVMYTALGKIWIKQLEPDDKPRRLTASSDYELYPAFSNDGRSIVYATWNDDSLGAIRTIGIDGRGGRKITTKMGHYVEPTFSRDGTAVQPSTADQSKHLWQVRPPAEGTVEWLESWAQVVTALELEADGGVHSLDAATWQARQRDLTRTGPSPPTGASTRQELTPR